MMRPGKSLLRRLFTLSVCILLWVAGCFPSSTFSGQTPFSATIPSTSSENNLTTPFITTTVSAGESTTQPGEVTAPYPTISNISIEWLINGDANNNGVVSVRFRKKGTDRWQEGMPLLRIPAGSNHPDSGFSWPNKFSGSIFDLEADTNYEIELTLFDPDGGSTTRTLAVQTRSVPTPMPHAPIHSVTPDTFVQAIDYAQPGDILDLGAGEYDGFTFLKDGEPGRPIVIRSTTGAIINGSINLDERKQIILEGLVVNGSIHFYNGDSISVMHCRVNTTGDGIVFMGHAQNAYIADNVVIGSTVWQKTALGVNGDNNGEGIQFSGPGHVIEHNTVIGFRDNISLMEGAQEAIDQFSIDILDNDIYEAADDGVEADYCFNNCRIMRNRLTNVFMGVSSQPGLGGPTYFIRNVMYNVVYEPFKLHNGSVGDVVLQNTVVKSGDAIGVYTGDYFSRAYFRNNIFIGGPGGIYNGYNSGKGLIASLESADPTCTFDYDAFGTLDERFLGQIGSHLFSSLDGLHSKTSEIHAIQVDLNIFATPVDFPATPFPALPVPDLRPKAEAVVEDTALLIPNINNHFTGNGPDIGAYEVGDPLPEYGVRGATPGGTFAVSVPTPIPTAPVTPAIQPTTVPLDTDLIADFNSPLPLTDGTAIDLCNSLILKTAGSPELAITGEGTLLARSLDKADGFIIRSTAPLPKTYRINVDIGNIAFDLLKSADQENGMYFLVISDMPGQPTDNNWWHAHRKVSLDTDNNIWDSGGQHPIFWGYYNPSVDMLFYDGSLNRWGNDWNAVANYKPETWYTFDLEKTETEYIFRVYDRANGILIKQANILINKVTGGSAPDYLAIGDPHTNYYNGSVEIDNIRITNIGCSK